MRTFNVNQDHDYSAVSPWTRLPLVASTLVKVPRGRHFSPGHVVLRGVIAECGEHHPLRLIVVTVTFSRRSVIDYAGNGWPLTLRITHKIPEPSTVDLVTKEESVDSFTAHTSDRRHLRRSSSRATDNHTRHGCEKTLSAATSFL